MKGLIYYGKECIIVLVATEDICGFVLGLTPGTFDVYYIHGLSLSYAVRTQDIFKYKELGQVSNDIS